ncbi:hypothetical protein N8387_04895 [Polaribacter sp.]|nr:hypothetical protein [Polaribacter sp.]
MPNYKTKMESIMTKNTLKIILLLLITGCTHKTEVWRTDTQEEWQVINANSSNLEIKDGLIYPKNDSAYFSTTLKKFKNKNKLQSIMLKQNPQWANWQAIPKVTPEMAEDAPVFIPISNKDYWFLARYKGDKTTGYHSWHSTDMKNWRHYGPISTVTNKWVTSAEYMDGKFYIYFDKPNDEDPHLIIDDDLTDGKQGEEIGMVFDDPSHGSDMAIFRDDDETFHLIYEDWSPLDPSIHSWDSPLAGHADSPDGIHGFEPHEFPAPIDERSTPTGKIEPYKPHPNQILPEKDLSPYNYEVHDGPQDAFGDYTVIKVGKEYYIFCDYDSHQEDKTMRVGRWCSDDVTKQFVWDGEIGEGFHPDPTVGFAEGKFYLLVQRNNYDFISDGPWVDGVEIRAGVDTDNDGSIDKWTKFTKVKETYSQKAGYVKVIESLPAILNVSELAAGYAFKIEIRFNNKNHVFPILDSFEANFID